MLDAEPCPCCGRCAFCGKELGADELRCTCSGAHDPDSAAASLAKHVVPNDRVEHERRRIAMRNQLRTAKAIAMSLVVVGWMIMARLAKPDLPGQGTWIASSLYILGVVGVAVLSLVLVHLAFRAIENRRFLAQDNASGRTDGS